MEEVDNHPVFFFFPLSNLPSVLPQVESSPKPAARKPGKWSFQQGRAAQGKEGKESESKWARGARRGVAPRRCPSGASSLTQATSAVQGRGKGHHQLTPPCATSVPGAFHSVVDLLTLNTMLHSSSIPTLHKRKLRLGGAGRVTARTWWGWGSFGYSLTDPRLLLASPVPVAAWLLTSIALWANVTFSKCRQTLTPILKDNEVNKRKALTELKQNRLFYSPYF